MTNREERDEAKNLKFNTASHETSLRNLADPKPELKDHAGERPEIVNQLIARHEAWEKNVNAK